MLYEVFNFGCFVVILLNWYIIFGYEDLFEKVRFFFLYVYNEFRVGCCYFVGKCVCVCVCGWYRVLKFSGLVFRVLLNEVVYCILFYICGCLVIYCCFICS